MTASTLTLETLSTGRPVLVGRHSYSSMVLADGTEMDSAAWVALTDAEQSEAWALVDAKLHARRTETPAKWDGIERRLSGVTDRRLAEVRLATDGTGRGTGLGTGRRSTDRRAA